MKFSILIMIAAAIGMIHGLKKQKAGYRWGKPLAVGCACVALLFALVHISSSGGPNMNTVIENYDVELEG